MVTFLDVTYGAVRPDFSAWLS